MTTPEISRQRLLSQKIEQTNFATAGEIVGWMGAMQAQDFSMALSAVGIRLKDATEAMVEAAFNQGEILRTHLMRPTWHFVTPEDIHWLLALTAPQVKAQSKSRDRQLELTEAVFSKGLPLIEKLLSQKPDATREEISSILNTAGIRTDDNRLSHIMLRAELEGLVCSGPLRGRRQTYALLANRAPYKRLPGREESLALLASRYFNSHGPATINDFVWWSGLSLTTARQALELVKSSLHLVTLENKTYLHGESVVGSGIKPIKKSVHLLPAYDEFLISYRDRSASIGPEINKMAVSVNGIFRPVIVVNGQVEGLWRRTRQKEKTIIEATFLLPQDKATLLTLKKAAARYAKFHDRETEFRTVLNSG